jgi:capsular polysaccharide biosynthesis protein
MKSQLKMNPYAYDDGVSQPRMQRRRLVSNVPSSVRPFLRVMRFTATKALTAAVKPALKYAPATSRDFGPPRHFVSSLQDYAEASRDGSAAFIELYPAHDVVRKLPVFVPTNGSDDAIRTEFVNAQYGESPAAGVAVIEGGRVLTDRGTIIAPPDVFIADVSDAWTSGDEIIYPIFLSPRLPRVTTTDETVAVLSSHCSWSNYGHWLGDTLPRLHLLEKSGIHYDKIVVPYLTGYQREALRLLGVDRSKLIVNPRLHLQARRLVIPTFPGVYGLPPRWACDYLRERLLPSAQPSDRPRRIFVSRNKPGATRRLLNEDALYEGLRHFGVERVFTEDLSFAEEVSLFNNAEIVIGPCGAGMVNLIFCQPGTSVIEIFSPRYVNVMNWMIANHADLKYAYSLGNGSALPMSAGDRGMYEDITANPQEVMRLFLLLCRP